METSSMDNGNDLSIHRNSLSYIVRHLYAAVQSLKHDSKKSNLTHICKYMQHHHSLRPAECIAQLKLCISEGLLQLIDTGGKRNSQIRKKQKEYVIPEYEKAGHDWYCFECHMGGPVIHCSYCHRVFHTKCFKGICAEKKLCYVCECPIDCTRTTKQNLNRILGFLCKNVNELVSNALVDWKILKLDKVVMNALIYNQMDWYTIQQKIWKLVYCHMQEFRADVQTFLHNVVIYYGDSNTFTEQVKNMIGYCELHMKEIELCDDCYVSSNCKNEKNWFCKPCKTPHKLVFGKLETHPYEFWPAKVIEQKQDMYEVKFFGSQHTQSRLPKSHVKPLNPDLEELKKWADSPAKKKAHRELKIHILWLGRLKRFRKTDLIQGLYNSRIMEKRKKNNMIKKTVVPRSAAYEQISSLHLPSTSSELHPEEMNLQIVQETQNTPEPKQNEEFSPDVIFDCVIIRGKSGLETRKYFPNAVATKMLNDVVSKAREVHREKSRQLKANLEQKLNDRTKKVKETRKFVQRLKKNLSEGGVSYFISRPRQDDTYPHILQKSSFHDGVL